MKSFIDLPARDEDGVTVVIEVAAGTRNKVKVDPKTGLMKLSSILPAGTTFPYDFGFVPSTRAEDGDPLDVLVLMDAPAFAGCVVPVRVLGAMEALQREKGSGWKRNDRLIAVAAKSHRYGRLKEIGDLDDRLLGEIEDFFVYANEHNEKELRILRRVGARAAERLLKESEKRFRNKRAA